MDLYFMYIKQIYKNQCHNFKEKFSSTKVELTIQFYCFVFLEKVYA